MDIESLLVFMDFYASETLCIFESGILFALVVFFVFAILNDVSRLLEVSVVEKRNAARCLGLHNGTINSVCRNHSCPHSRQCVYHVPRRTLRVWFSDVVRKFHR